MRYNSAMTQWYRRPQVWFALALTVVIAAALALWLRGAQSGSDRSPLSTPVASVGSPLPTPTRENTAPPPSAWTNGGAVLLWVALGILLALGITFVMLRWYRDSA